MLDKHFPNYLSKLYNLTIFLPLFVENSGEVKRT